MFKSAANENHTVISCCADVARRVRRPGQAIQGGIVTRELCSGNRWHSMELVCKPAEHPKSNTTKSVPDVQNDGLIRVHAERCKVVIVLLIPGQAQ